MNSTIYNDLEYEILDELCVEHAVFAWVEEFGLVEADFIKWLSDNAVSFQSIISSNSNLYPHMKRYCKELQDLDKTQDNN